MVTPKVVLEVYKDERQLKLMQPLIDRDLSEPYSIFTYRYFIKQWPDLCYLAMEGEECIGAVVCKLEANKRKIYRGYIAMLAVREDRRKQGLGTKLVAASIEAMIAQNCEEVALEAEVTNKGALRLYENLGFIRDKRLEKYYLNGLVLPVKVYCPTEQIVKDEEDRDIRCDGARMASSQPYLEKHPPSK